MKRKYDGHYFETILPTFNQFFENSVLTDLCLVCSDGNVFSYRLILASISNFLKDLLLDTADSEVIYLPDIETKDVQLLHDCLLKGVPDDFASQKLSHLFDLFKIQLETFLDATSTERDKPPEIESKILYKCTHCGKVYSNHTSFVKHIKVHDIEEKQRKIDEIEKSRTKEQIDSEEEEVDIAGSRPRRKPVRPKKFEDSVLPLEIGDIDICCVTCNQQFSSKDELNLHTNELHGPQDTLSTAVHLVRKKRKRRKNNLEFVCDTCGKSFSSKQAQNNHLLLHKDERRFNCDICDKKFVASGALHNHKKLLHQTNEAEAKTLQCKLCPKQFHNGSNLQRHIRALHFEHSDKKKFVCGQCDKEFTDPSALSAHKKTHSIIKPHQCKECSRRFTTGAQLRVHMRIHEGVRPFQCSVCDDRTFTTKGQLDSHFLHRHVGVKLSKNHLCTECGASFVKSHDLSVHMLRHTGEMPFKCDHCDKGFRSQRNLRNHTRTHTGEKPYRCETCGKNFSATGGLRQHFLTKASCRMNASEGAYSIKKQQQVEIMELDSDQLDQHHQDQHGEIQTVVLVSQEGQDHEEQGHSNLISIADAASLTASGFAFVEIPSNVDLSDAEAIVLQAHVHNSQ